MDQPCLGKFEACRTFLGGLHGACAWRIRRFRPWECQRSPPISKPWAVSEASSQPRATSIFTSVCIPTSSRKWPGHCRSPRLAAIPRPSRRCSAGFADFAIGDATMAVISREERRPRHGGVGTVVQRGPLFRCLEDRRALHRPQKFKGMGNCDSPEPNTNFSVTKRLIESNGIEARRGRHHRGRRSRDRDRSHAGGARRISPSPTSLACRRAVAQGSKYRLRLLELCGTVRAIRASWSCRRPLKKDPGTVQALVTSFEEAGRRPRGSGLCEAGGQVGVP